ncbi:carbohydrate ABC transporter permease [Amnibacterium endophyticum]|uniref:Carbohydrate ABC transporter permease n=1 Tax=Amnibacterium endophyticum TaxID=2109337 RepID=A0ABW4LCB7_9MICO
MTVGTPIRVEGGGTSPSTRAVSVGPRRRRRIRWTSAWLFMAPSLLILGVFVIYPIVVSFWYSLHDWTIGSDVQPFLGLGNYLALTRDPQFWNALVNTLELTVVSVAALVVLGLALAIALLRDSFITKAVRSAFFFPTVVSLTSIGLVWRFLLDPQLGLVAGISETLGLPAVDWLQSTALALPAVIFVDIWKNLGFVMIIMIGGLKGVPAERYEAGRLDGAGDWQLVRFITLPSIRPTLLFATLILTIQSLQLFDLVYVMTGGGPLFATDTLVTEVFREGFVNYRTGYASAISWVLFALIMLISLVQLRIFRYDDVD